MTTSYNTILGTETADSLVGTSGADSISAVQGGDTIDGKVVLTSFSVVMRTTLSPLLPHPPELPSLVKKAMTPSALVL